MEERDILHRVECRKHRRRAALLGLLFSALLSLLLTGCAWVGGGSLRVDPITDVRGVETEISVSCVDDPDLPQCLAATAVKGTSTGGTGSHTGTSTDTDGGATDGGTTGSGGTTDDSDGDGFRDGLDPFPLDAAKNVTNLSGADLVTFWSGLSASGKSELVGLLSGSQLETVLAGFPASDVASFWSVLSASQQTALLDDLTLTQAVALASTLSNAQVETLLGRFGNGTDLTTFWGALSIAQRNSLLDNLTLTQVVALASTLSEAQLVTLLGRFSGADLRTLWAALSSAQQAALLDDLTLAQAVDLASVLSEAQLVTVMAGFSGADLRTLWAALSAAQQTALLDDLTLAQAVALASVLSEAQLVTVLGRFSGSDLVTLWNALSAAQQISLFDDLTSGQLTTLISAAEAGELVLADAEGTASLMQQSGLSTQEDLEATLRNEGGNVLGQGLGPGYTTNALDPTNTAGLDANPTGVAQPYQALYSPQAIAAINADGLLAYAVQVEEDRVNRSVMERVQALGSSDVRSDLWDSINTLLANGSIRERDALLEQEADARAGRVLVDQSGNRVRVQQYVLRPNDNTVQVVSVSLRGSGAGDLAGLSYIDWQTRFNESIAGLTAQEVRDLPWSDWLGTRNRHGTRAVDNPRADITLNRMSVEFANGGADLLREERAFETLPHTTQGPPHQHITSEMLSIQKAGGSLANYFFTTSSNPSSGRYTVLGGVSDGVNPTGFLYRYNDGSAQDIPVDFFVLGDALSTPTTGVQTNTCGSGGASLCSDVAFNDIWDALRVNMGGTAQHIGSNNLEISIDRAKSFFSVPIDAVYIPWTRMAWQ